MQVRAILRLPLALALVAGGAIFVAPPAAAGVGVGVAPSLLELSATPGGTGEQTLRVSNTGDEPTDVGVAVVALDGASAADSAVGWLTARPTSVHLEPEQVQEVEITISVPEGLESGGYYAAVALTTGASGGEGSGVAVAAQVQVPFLFAVEGAGDLTRGATIERFAPVLEADGRVGFRTIVRSTGNVYVKAQGAVEIADARGERYASLELPNSGRILPDSTKTLVTQGSVPLEAGETYEARLALTYGDEPESLTTTERFTVSQPTVAVGELSVCENLDRGPTLTVGVHNDGELGAQPSIGLKIQTADGQIVGETTVPASTVLVWPNSTETFAFDFPQRLESGAYVFVATTQLGSSEPSRGELPFQIGGVDGTPAPLCENPLTPEGG